MTEERRRQARLDNDADDLVAPQKDSLDSEVRELLSALKQGLMTLDEVAARFRARTWPQHPPAPAYGTKEYADWYWAVRDMEPDPPGSVNEIDYAYDSGQLTAEQAKVLRYAALESISTNA